MLFDVLYDDSLATRELAAVLASVWMQENLPLTAKLSSYMKQKNLGTNYVPSYRVFNGNRLSSFINYFLPEDCRIRTHSDFYYATAIAFASIGFIFPILFIISVACVIAAKRKESNHETN